MNWTQKLQNWLNFGFYARCPFCDRPAVREFCQDCLHQIRSCQLSDSHPCWSSSLPVVSWGDYRGALKRAIALLKYDNQPQIARPLGQWLGETWLSSHTTLPTVLVVPIPLYRAKEQQRGYNQAALIAHSFCDITGFPLRSQGLERVRKTAAQFGLSNLERERNLSQAFVLGRDFLQKSPGYPVLLLDDIYTTGATVRSAVKTLEQSGIQVSGLVVVAKAQLDRPQPAD